MHQSHGGHATLPNVLLAVRCLTRLPICSSMNSNLSIERIQTPNQSPTGSARYQDVQSSGYHFSSTNHILTTSTAPKDAVARTMHAMSFVPTVDACHLIPSSNALDFGANTCSSALSVSALRRPLRIRGPAKIKPAKHIINPS